MRGRKAIVETEVKGRVPVILRDDRIATIKKFLARFREGGSKRCALI